MHQATLITCLLALLAWSPALMGHAQPSPAALSSPSGEQILQRAAAVTGGDDGRAHITFTFKQPGQAEQKIGYAMLWKHTKDKAFASKVIYFTEFPTADRGKAYLGHIRPAGSTKPDKEWLYLPELLAVRKLTGHDHKHGNAKPDEFSASVLTHADLMDRPPSLDSHRLLDSHQLLGSTELNGNTMWRVESRPKQADNAYPYSAVIRWIDTKNHLTHRTEYLGPDNTPIKRADTTWAKIDGEWVWKKVVADHLITGAQTTIEMTDVAVNLDLPDRTFTTRTLSKGPKRLF
jgi:hypothetical protein